MVQRPIFRLRGVSLVEASIGLLVLGLVMAASVPYAISLQQQALDEQSARQLQLVQEAADVYVKANFAALEAQIVAAAGQPQAVSIQQLLQGAYLPSGFLDTNGFGQTHKVIVRRTNPGVLEATIFTAGGTTPSDVRAAGIANRIPGGAYVGHANPNMLQGAGFQMPLAVFASAPVQPRAGSISATLLFRGDTVLTDYLYRNPVPGYPQAQQLGPGSTLDLNNQPVVNAGTIAPVPGRPLTIAGDLRTTGASTFLGPVVVDNQLRATGGAQLANLFVGQLAPNWISSTDSIVAAIGNAPVATVTAGNMSIAGNMQVSGAVDFGHDVWHTSGGFNRLYFSGTGATAFGGTSWAFQTSGGTVAQVGADGGVQILGSGNFTVPALSNQGLMSASGTAWIRPQDAAGNTHIHNGAGGVLIDGASVTLGDPSGNSWLGVSGAGASFNVPVTVNSDLTINADAFVAGTLSAARIVTSGETINGDLAVNGAAHFRGGIDNDAGTLTIGARSNQTTIATKLTVQGGRGQAECCGTDATLSITGDAVRPPSIDWQFAGVAEGTMQLSATGWRRIEFADQQGQGLGIHATGRIHTTGNLTADGNVQLTGGGNFIVPAQTVSGVVTTAGTAFLHLDDPSHNTQLANAAGGGIFLDAAAFHARDTMGSDWLAIAAAGASFTVPVTVNASLTAMSAIYARGGVWNDQGALALGAAGQATNIAGAQIALNGPTTIQSLTVTGTASILGAAVFQSSVTINGAVAINGNEIVNGQAQATNFVIPDSGYAAGEACGPSNAGKSRWNPTLYSNLGGMERCVGGAAAWRPFSEYQWGSWTPCDGTRQSRQCVKLGQNYPVSDARYCGGAGANDFSQSCLSCMAGQQLLGGQCCSANVNQSCVVHASYVDSERFQCGAGASAADCSYDEFGCNGVGCLVCTCTYPEIDGVVQCDGSCKALTCGYDAATNSYNGAAGALNPPLCNQCAGTLQPVSEVYAPGLNGPNCVGNFCFVPAFCGCPYPQVQQGVNCYACANGAIDWPSCDACQPGWILFPDPATGIQHCHPPCHPPFHYDDNGICTGGCANGAINFPQCNQCGAGFIFQNGVCVPNTCVANQGQSCGGTGTIQCDGSCSCPAGQSFNGTICAYPACSNGTINPPACNQCPAGQVFNGTICTQSGGGGYSGIWTAGACSKACGGGTISGSTCSNGNCDPATNPDGTACNTQPPQDCSRLPSGLITCGADQGIGPGVSSVLNAQGQEICAANPVSQPDCLPVGGQINPTHSSYTCTASCTFQADLTYNFDGCKCTPMPTSLPNSGTWYTSCTNGQGATCTISNAAVNGASFNVCP